MAASLLSPGASSFIDHQHDNPHDKMNVPGFYPPLPPNSAFIEGLYAAMPSVTRRALTYHRRRFIAMHVAHARWASYAGREFDNQDLCGKWHCIRCISRSHLYAERLCEYMTMFVDAYVHTPCTYYQLMCLACQLTMLVSSSQFAITAHA